MIQKQAGVQIVLQVDKQLCLPFPHQPVTPLAIQLLILLVAFLALTGAQMHLLPVHAQGGAHGGYRQIPTMLGLFRINRFRRLELLHQHLIAVDVHCHIELGQIPVVEAITLDIFPLQPAAQVLAILAQAIDQRLRPFRHLKGG